MPEPTRPEENTLYRGLEKVPPELWDDLDALDPALTAARAGVKYTDTRGYTVPFLGTDHHVDPRARTITAPEGARPPGFQAGMVLINYLIFASDQGISGRMVTERELNGGELFFKGPHALMKAPVIETFGRDGAAMVERAKAFGAIPAEAGDAAFKLLVLPKILVSYTLYEADDEFKAGLTITFDASMDKHLPLDAIWAMINVLSHRLTDLS